MISEYERNRHIKAVENKKNEVETKKSNDLLASSALFFSNIKKKDCLDYFQTVFCKYMVLSIWSKT